MTRTSRLRALSRVAVAATCLGLAMPAAAIADKVIISSGPIEKIWVGSDLACQVSYQSGDTYEFFPPDSIPGDCGTMIGVDGLLYAPDFESHGEGSAADDLEPAGYFEPQNQTLQGSGSATDPYLITTDVTAYDGLIQVQQRISYVTGQSSLRVDMRVHNVSDGARVIRTYFAGDCYASGSDIGHGFVRPEIRSIGCSQNPDNNPPARTIQLLPLSPGSNGLEAFYSDVWGVIGRLSDLGNSCRCGESIDNGVALQWRQSLPSIGTAEYSLQVAFTESAPQPLADTDGDSLPDAWETGQGTGADAENLAQLGADPNRPDIFVHADWMAGCQPPIGWEQRTVQMFAAHGITLHVDSGPASLNANGQPWGAFSRAGEIPFAADLDLVANWSALDAVKDLHMVPSGRRRAFRYTLFANQLRTPSNPTTADFMGVARGIPDSDFVVGNCGLKPRADASFFTHELGHTLGLRHGGFEHVNFKPNHYSAMNYGWSLWALADEKRFVPYSETVLPPVDELHVNEHAGLALPLVFYCVKDNQLHNFLGKGVFTDGDFDCDGTYGETDVKANLNGDNSNLSWIFNKRDPKLDIFESSLLGFNDWISVKLTGGGVIGAQTLPPRVDTPAEPELTGTEIATAITAGQAATKAQAKQLRLVTKIRQLRKPKRRNATVTLKVIAQTAAGKTLKDVQLRVRGAKLAGSRKLVRSGRRGRATLRLQLRSSKQLTVTAKRRGYRTATLLVPVVRRR